MQRWYYFAHGVKSCWLVIPRLKNVYVFSDPQNYQIFRTDQTLHDPALGIDLEGCVPKKGQGQKQSPQPPLESTTAQIKLLVNKQL
jgi:hypothetical protein